MPPLSPWARSLGRLVFVGAALCAFSISRPAAATPVASFSPDPASVTAGNTIDVTLDDTLPALVGGIGVGAVDLTVTYDPTLVTFESVAVGNLLSGWNATAGTPSGGVVGISIAECGLCTDAGGGPDSVLTLTFLANAGDTTTTTSYSAVTADFAVGIDGEYQLASTSGTIDITAASQPVPAPGLPLLAFPALLLIRRRTSRA